MALVGYSDSEDSDVEKQPETIAAPDKSKKFDRTTTKKIKVDLAGLTSKPADDSIEAPASKRQRTAGAFSGFNALLPAPKRTAQSNIKRNISLRTSSEAAFSREAPRQHEESSVPPNDLGGDSDSANTDAQTDASKLAEVKLVGKATRFVPLSVANARKKKKPLMPPTTTAHVSLPPSNAPKSETKAIGEPSTTQTISEPTPPKSKPKKSLFSSGLEDKTGRTASSQSYQPEFSESAIERVAESQDYHQALPTTLPSDSAGAGLQNVAADLSLSASERRRLFGRHAGRDDIKIAHFNMDAEYRANQELAAKGDLVEHRAVKAIAPGKHSLQQLVNNVKGQTDALEDKWAEGRRNRSEAGNKYGW